jgi:hypothetical protein
MNLYKLTGQYAELIKMIDDGDCTQEELIGVLSVIECNIEDKTQNMVYLLKNLDTYSLGVETELKRLSIMLGSIETKRESIKNYLFSQLESAGINEIKTNIATIKQQKNPASVVIEDESKIPAAYQTIIPESYKISKTEIAKVLKAGINVPGAKLQQSFRWVIK